jgi:hypothetical protein
MIFNPVLLVLAYLLGGPICFPSFGLDYFLRNSRWQWLCIVLASAFLCSYLDFAKGSWLLGGVAVAVCSFLANLGTYNQIRPEDQIGPQP